MLIFVSDVHNDSDDPVNPAFPDASGNAYVQDTRRHPPVIGGAVYRLVRSVYVRIYLYKSIKVYLSIATFIHEQTQESRLNNFQNIETGFVKS